MSAVESTNNVNAANPLFYTQTTGVDRADGNTDENDEFAKLIAEALRELANDSMSNAYNTGNPAGTGTAGIPGFYLNMPSTSNTIEQAITTAASSGNNNDAMVALLMLMMMMQSGSGGDMTMMFQMMASMFEQTQDKQAIRDEFMYSSGADPYTLDTIDTQVFHNPLPDVSSTRLYKYSVPDITNTAQAELPLEWWRPTTPAIVSTEEYRSPELYNAVVAQFNVETAERYRPGREGYTFCNVYVWDVTRAMGAELPYYVDPDTGAPREYPDTKGALYNGAKAMDRWLRTYGEKFGWRQVSAEEAQMHANQGKPAVTAAGDVGHVQMVVPSQDGTFDPIRGVAIAQAGRTVSNYMHISGIYGSKTLNEKVSYWVHD